MKTMMTAVVAMAMTMNAWASHQHSAACLVNCPEDVKVAAIAPVGPDSRMASLKNASEDRQSMLRYTKVMQNMLAGIETQKHLNAIIDLEAENAYHNMMALMLENMEQQKLADQIEDLNAGKRYEDMMNAIFAETAKK
ncbi:MAG: hypothetical protein MUE71_12230 [Chitinophagaceae bacterium]|jgi:hypothetical protein|nr:hypothetical protein [Chitinophagaceae bacterium]MCU0403901.1 hypothetical protein [Chitinophagaceae bacterium]